MRKYIVVIILTLLFSFNANAEKMQEYSFHCPELSFAIIPSVTTINFSNIDLFSIAEMVADRPIGYTQNSGKTINANFHWYYTTVIELKFQKGITEYADGEEAEVKFSFDDNDGISLEDQSLKCKVRVKNI